MRRGFRSELPSLVFFVLLLGGQWLLHLYSPGGFGYGAAALFAVWVLAASYAGTIAHEGGHALAVWLTGGQVTRIEIGGRRAALKVRAGRVLVSFGPGFGGRVVHERGAGPGVREVIILAAGPGLSLLVAPLCLLLPLPRWEAAYLALCELAWAIENLVPATTKDGRMTDGLQLLRVRIGIKAARQVRELLADPAWPDRPGAVDVLIDGFALDVPEAMSSLRELSHQPETLLAVYQRPIALPDRPEPDVTHVIHILTRRVLTGADQPAGLADLAASRAEWVIAHLDSEHPDRRTPLAKAQATLAIARLRQGRPGEVASLCAPALAADLDPDDRATALATVAMARHSLLLSGQAALDEALALDPAAALVSEAAQFVGGGWETALAALPAAPAGGQAERAGVAGPDDQGSAR